MRECSAWTRARSRARRSSRPQTSTWNQRIACCPLEGRAAAALVADDGRLTVWASVQTPNQSRAALAKALGLAEEEVRVIVPDVGGGFGPKAGVGAEEILVAWLARR